MTAIMTTLTPFYEEIMTVFLQITWRIICTKWFL